MFKKTIAATALLAAFVFAKDSVAETRNPELPTEAEASNSSRKSVAEQEGQVTVETASTDEDLASSEEPAIVDEEPGFVDRLYDDMAAFTCIPRVDYYFWWLTSLEKEQDLVYTQGDDRFTYNFCRYIDVGNRSIKTRAFAEFGSGEKIPLTPGGKFS